MINYFTSNELFSSQQFGFRANRSTELAALELMDRNIDKINQIFSPINIYIDLCKAFDCLDHVILLSKLKYYGLNDNAIKLLKNYLSDRDQYVQLGNFKSQYHISCGWALFYSILSLPSATKNFDFGMYADDTTLVPTLETFGRTCNVKEIERNINIEISKVTTWLQRNKLQLNVSKSKFIMFFKHPKKLKFNVLKAQYNSKW